MRVIKRPVRCSENIQKATTRDVRVASNIVKTPPIEWVITSRYLIFNLILVSCTIFLYYARTMRREKKKRERDSSALYFDRWR